MTLYQRDELLHLGSYSVFMRPSLLLLYVCFTVLILVPMFPLCIHETNFVPLSLYLSICVSYVSNVSRSPATETGLSLFLPPLSLYLSLSLSLSIHVSHVSNVPRSPATETGLSLFLSPYPCLSCFQRSEISGHGDRTIFVSLSLSVSLMCQTFPDLQPRRQDYLCSSLSIRVSHVSNVPRSPATETGLSLFLSLYPCLSCVQRSQISGHGDRTIFVPLSLSVSLMCPTFPDLRPRRQDYLWSSLSLYPCLSCVQRSQISSHGDRTIFAPLSLYPCLSCVQRSQISSHGDRISLFLSLYPCLSCVQRSQISGHGDRTIFVPLSLSVSLMCPTFPDLQPRRQDYLCSSLSIRVSHVSNVPRSPATDTGLSLFLSLYPCLSCVQRSEILGHGDRTIFVPLSLSVSLMCPTFPDLRPRRQDDLCSSLSIRVSHVSHVPRSPATETGLSLFLSLYPCLSCVQRSQISGHGDRTIFVPLSLSVSLMCHTFPDLRPRRQDYLCSSLSIRVSHVSHVPRSPATETGLSLFLSLYPCLSCVTRS